MNNVKAGDLFVSQWGYEQTNIRSYQVLKVSGVWITLQEIEKNIDRLINSTDMTRDYTLKTGLGIVSSDKKPFRRKLIDFKWYTNDPTVKICSYEYAHLYKGEVLNESSYA